MLFLKNGRYFYHTKENKIEEIEITKAEYINGDVFYNGSQLFDIDRVLVLDEEGKFRYIQDVQLETSFLSQEINGMLWLEEDYQMGWINMDGVVTEEKFGIYRYDLNNEVVLELYYEENPFKQVRVNPQYVYPTKELALNAGI